MTNFQLISITVYLLICGAVIYQLHLKLADRWRKYEYARWALGILTVVGGALFLSAIEVLDTTTVVVIAAAFGVAAIVKFLAVTKDQVNSDLERSNQIKEKARSYADTIER